MHTGHAGAIACAMPNTQLGLFDDDPAARPATRHEFVASPEFVERIRSELTATLAMVRAADRLPWPDLTRTTLAELRFRSIVRWLPAEEAEALRAAFDTEIDRLYAPAARTPRGGRGGSDLVPAHPAGCWPRKAQPVMRRSRTAKAAYITMPMAATTIRPAKTSGTLKLELACSMR